MSHRRPPSDDGLFVVGVVGQAGSGKSTVARALGRDGAVVIDADVLGHDVVDHDPDVRAALAAEYGEDVYGPEGLDRARVSALVFRDAAARERLNRLVHPRIVEGIYAQIGELEDRGYQGVVVVDAALLLDWRFERECDAVIAVTARRAKQLDRLRAQRGWSADEAELRLAVQRSAAELAAAADVTLENDGTEADLEQSARAALRRLRDARLNPKGHDATSC